MKSNNHYLFSYGTLQLKNVQLKNYGRELIGFKDIIKNYKIEQLKITAEELRQTDIYEVSDYKRVLEIFQSEKKAWIYIFDSNQ